MNINTSFSLSFSIKSHQVMKDCHYIEVIAHQTNSSVAIANFYITDKSLKILNDLIAQKNYDFSSLQKESYNIFQNSTKESRGDIVFYDNDFFMPTVIAKNAERFKQNKDFNDKDEEMTIKDFIKKEQGISQDIKAYYKIGDNNEAKYYDENQELVYQPAIINLQNNIYAHEQGKEFINYIQSLYAPSYWKQEFYRSYNSSSSTKNMDEYMCRDLSKGFSHKAIYLKEDYAQFYSILEQAGYDYKTYEKNYRESTCYLKGKILLALEAPQFIDFIFNGGLKSFSPDAPTSQECLKIIELDNIIAPIIHSIVRKRELEKSLSSDNAIQHKPKI